MSTFLKIYNDLFAYGKPCAPRGEEIKELENYQATFAPYERLSSFRARNLNLGYCKQEFLWYLRGDRYDTSIEEHAKMWQKLRDVDGGFNSNYGQYLFKTDEPRRGGSQLEWVVDELTRDPHSRRACMVLLSPSHLRENNVDVVCTYAISFRVRDFKLNMSVSMRSNDAIFGLTNDVFCFSMIHEMVFELLRYDWINTPEDNVLHYLGRTLELGTYTHKVDSLHVYQRHYDMLRALVSEGVDGYEHIEVPRGDARQFAALLTGGVLNSFDAPLINWLTQ